MGLLLALALLAACSGAPARGESGPTTAIGEAPATTTVATTAPPTSTVLRTVPTRAPSTSTTVAATTTVAAPSSTTTTTVPEVRLATLAEGATGPEVITLQRMLNNVTGSELVANGIFGPTTTEALTNFQLFTGLLVTGVADHETRLLLTELDAGRATAVPTWPVPTIGDGGADGCQVAVVGDSLMAGAAALHSQALAAIGCASAVDGVGGRSLNFGWQCRIAQPDGRTPLLLVSAPEPGNRTCAPSGLELVAGWARAGALGDLVVVALGTNDAGIHPDERTWVAHWERVAELTAPRPIVLLTTAARPGSTRVAAQAAYSAALRRWCDAHDLCHLADWASSATALDPGSYVDAVHLTRAATEQRARFIADAVSRLLTGAPAPDPTPLPTTTTSTPTTTTITTPSTTTSTTSSTTSTTTTSSTSTTTTSTTVPATTSTTTTTATTATTTSTTTTSVPDAGGE
jgi:hypothetical protein